MTYTPLPRRENWYARFPGWQSMIVHSGVTTNQDLIDAFESIIKSNEEDRKRLDEIQWGIANAETPKELQGIYPLMKAFSND